MSDLTLSERTDLVAHEKAIQVKFADFVDVGRRLSDIRDRRLYRQDYASFRDYCRERWQLSHAYAYFLIDAAEVASTLVDIPNERVARELSKVEDVTERAAVWSVAVNYVEDPAKVTTATIRDAKTVVETIIATDGHVDIGDGKMTPVKAAMRYQESERLERKDVHINESYGGKSEPLFKDSDTLQDALRKLAEFAAGQDDQQQVTIIVYKAVKHV